MTDPSEQAEMLRQQYDSVASEPREEALVKDGAAFFGGIDCTDGGAFQKLDDCTDVEELPFRVARSGLSFRVARSTEELDDCAVVEPCASVVGAAASLAL